MDLFESLNKMQQEAVAETEGRIRIVAGAGSGKTRVLAHRFAYLVNEIGIDPSNILCTTFTNKAAKEMSFRIAKLVDQNNCNGFVCTIHGFCVKFLREEIHTIGFPKNFTILDEDDVNILAKDVLKDLNQTIDVQTVRKFLGSVNGTKSSFPDYIKLFLPDQNLKPEDIQDKFGRTIADDVFVYIMRQVKLFALSFEDLIYVTLYILKNYPQSLKKWSERLNYIMVDEAQDLNHNQWEILELLASANNNLFIVGDPDQAIYEWRGASPKFFLDFKDDKTIILNQNYRSTPNILNVANSVISHNKDRIKKDLYTQNEPQTTVIHKHAKSEDDECDWITNLIQKAVSDHKAKLSDFAILYRASYLSRIVEQKLIQKNIKYSVWGGIRFFERKEIKNIIAYLRLINGDDDISLLRVINYPSRELGEVFVNNLKHFASLSNCSLYKALKDNIDTDQLNRKGARDFIKMIESLRSLSGDIKISELTSLVLDETGMRKDLRTDSNEERMENVEELLSSIRLYESDNPIEDINLTNYLQDIALYTNADYKNDGDTVKLMTIHQAKGLEFPYVIVLGLSDGIFPSYTTLRQRRKAGEEEERRLMYVAITRAEKGLFLTESEGYCFSTRSSKFPSRFLREIKQDWLVLEGSIPDELWRGTEFQVQELSDEMPMPEFRVGETVIHNIFGEGTILDVLPNGSCKVNFGQKSRVLMSKFLTKPN